MKKSVLMLIIVLFFVVSCGKTGGKTATLAYVNWAEGVAYTNMLKYVLEKKMGYKVKLIQTDVASAFELAAKGEVDAFMEVWLPYTHKHYYQKHKNNLTIVGPVYKGALSGLIVPAYLTRVNTISDLNKYKNKFGKKIIGIDPEAGIMKLTKDVIKSYNLDYELTVSDGPSMIKELRKGIGKSEWVVVTGWRPHWMFGRWNLKFLKQDKKKVWGSENIYFVCKKSLRQNNPELFTFLKKVKLSDLEISDLMLQIQFSEEGIEKPIKKWVKENKDVINTWLP